MKDIKKSAVGFLAMALLFAISMTIAQYSTAGTSSSASAGNDELVTIKGQFKFLSQLEKQRKGLEQLKELTLPETDTIHLIDDLLKDLPSNEEISIKRDSLIEQIENIRKHSPANSAVKVVEPV